MAVKYRENLYLLNAIQSFLNQKYKNKTLVISLNGFSPAQRARYEEALAPYVDNRNVKVINFNKMSKSMSLNNMFNGIASGYKLYTILDDDDVWTHNYKLAMQADLMLATGIDVCGTFARYCKPEDPFGKTHFDLKLEVFHDNIVGKMLAGENQIVNSSCMIDGKVITMCGGWNPILDGVEDYNMWLNLIVLDCIFVNIAEFCVNHSVYMESSYNAKGCKLPQELLKFYNDKYRGLKNGMA